MGGNYEKGIYNQLMDVMKRLDVMESECKKSHKDIRNLNAEVKSLRNENTRLSEELAAVKAQNVILTAENTALRKENQLLRDDNERMKRILNNDSSNSSTPPSTDQPGKAPNTYNSRKPTKKKAGAQAGHHGRNVSKTDVEKKIQEGVMEHQIKEIGDLEKPYITRYCLDLDIKAVATEIRIHADENGKFHIPDEYKADVSYGSTVKAVAAFLYSEGVVANDRICMFINSLSGDALGTATGSIYNFCRRFADACGDIRPAIENAILNSGEVCTDATVVTTNGKQTYIRNFSTKEHVLYCSCAKKEEKTLLNRLEKYKENHLLFLNDFAVPFSNNMSEKDLRICKNRQKMAGGFRNDKGRQMYCDIMSFVETVKRKKLNIFQSIVALIKGTPVIQ